MFVTFFYFARLMFVFDFTLAFNIKLVNVNESYQ